MASKDKLNELNTELEGDAAELQAVADAEAAIADTTDGGDDVAEAAALADAQANVDTTDTIAAADSLNITDFGMVSNETARKVLESKGKTVVFEEPENIISNHNMEIVG